MFSDDLYGGSQVVPGRRNTTAVLQGHLDHTSTPVGPEEELVLKLPCGAVSARRFDVDIARCEACDFDGIDSSIVQADDPWLQAGVVKVSLRDQNIIPLELAIDYAFEIGAVQDLVSTDRVHLPDDHKLILRHGVVVAVAVNGTIFGHLRKCHQEGGELIIEADEEGMGRPNPIDLRICLAIDRGNGAAVDFPIRTRHDLEELGPLPVLCVEFLDGVG